MEKFGLEKANGVSTPGTKDDAEDDEEDGEERLPPSQATLYRALTARANYLSMDRPEISYAVKELSRGMTAPTLSDWSRLKRLGRYLKKRPRARIFFPHQRQTRTVTVLVDTDFAGNKRTRKSTNGGARLLGTHSLKHWSTNQAVISLSSGESEYYGVVKGASMGLGFKSIAKDLGLDLEVNMFTDTSAALGISRRRGLGKTRHIQVTLLWVQERVSKGEIKLKKIYGKANAADLFTKHLAEEQMMKCMRRLGQEFLEGRDSLMPES